MRKRLYALLSLSIIFISIFSINTQAREAHRMPINVVREYTTTASWYKHGKVTANGERFNPYGLTAAHRTLPFGTKLRVTNISTNRTIIVRINDSGPYKLGRGLDLSLGAAQRIGMFAIGVTKLKIQILED